MANSCNSITVVVPVYNVARLLPRCVDSILSQTVSPLEIILVDDGSPDNCGEICDKYAIDFNHIKVVHKSNGGLSSARKAGLKVAKGDLIVFVDSDDYLDSAYLEKLSAPMDNPDIQLSMCAYATYNGKDFKSHYLPYKYNVIKQTDVSKDYIIPIVGKSFTEGSKNLPGFVWNRMYRTALLQEADFVSEREYFTEDVLMNISYGKRISGDVAIVNEPLYYYCINHGSLTLKYRNNACEMRMACYNRCKDLIRDLPVSLAEMGMRLDSNMISAITFCIYNAGRLSDYKDFRIELMHLLAQQDVRDIFKSGKWPHQATWHKIIYICYRLRAWYLLFKLLKLRSE